MTMGMMLAASALTAASTQLPHHLRNLEIVVPDLSIVHSVRHSSAVLGTSTRANRMLGLTSPS